MRVTHEIGSCYPCPGGWSITVLSRTLVLKLESDKK